MLKTESEEEAKRQHGIKFASKFEKPAHPKEQSR
jgi:hypothetical protein